MIDLENTISNLETNIRWIESTECHQFPGWGNVTMAMRDALELLKEQKSELLQQEAELDILRRIYKQENPYKQAVKWND